MPPRIGTKTHSFGRTYLREWRESVHLSLDQVVSRLPEEFELSKSSLSRIERGQQGYSQALLESLASLYNCDVDALVAYPPGDTAAQIYKSVQGLPAESQEQIAAIVATFASRR